MHFSASFDDSNIKRKLQNLLAAKKDALKAAGLVVLTEAQKTIINEGYGEWKPFKRIPRRAHQLLWDTGSMLRSLALGNAGNIFEEEDDVITVGSNVEYAAAQNFGVPKRDLPARPFLFLNEDRLQLAKEAFIATLQRAWSE